MDAFMGALIKMSLRGVVIILIVLLVRLLMKKLRISYKYILGLWTVAFLYFVFPWKISLPVGFWNNVNIPKDMGEISGLWPAGYEEGREGDDTVNIADPAGITDHIIADNTMAGVFAEKGTMGTAAVIPVEPAGKNIAGVSGRKENSPGKPGVYHIIGLIWLAGLSILFGHMLYSYFALKRKLRLSILWKENIWRAENINIPIVFGLIRPRIYLPVSMGSEDLPCVIAHEKMHIKRKDGLTKMLAYAVCLVHWFNPFIWIAYGLFGSDMEKACDEEVIRGMDKEKRKEYAYALLHIAAKSGAGKKRVFVAPISFNEGNIKSRIRNIMKYRYTVPGIGAAALIVILLLFVMFMTEAKGRNAEDKAEVEEAGEERAEEDGEENADPQRMGDENKEILPEILPEELPAFYVEDLDTLQIGENFSLEDYYITSRYTASNHYYIDENGVLWGSGTNEFGQLGTGTYGIEESYEEPVKIAENVLSVDASWNDYFCIYLTEERELYGIGLNYAGLLLGRGSESEVFSQDDFQKATKPVLLMTDVAYARAGRECIVALQNNKAAYWWGQYAPTTHTNADAVWENYWKLEEDPSNPVKMLASQPMKIMENCRYITTGTFTGAAVSEKGELYTWGFNVFGQCGTPVTGDDFIRTPVKVMDNVKMVWPERIFFSDPENPSSELGRWEASYDYNTFVLTEGDSLLAAGLNLGDQEKVTQVNGDLVETKTNRYHDEFVPVRAVEYSVNNNLAALGKLEFGMSIEETEKILSSSGIQTFRVDEGVYDEEDTVCLSAQYSQFHCYFDSQNKLARITVQEGGSRDGRFTLGMSLSDLEKTVRESGGTLTEIENNDTWDIWAYQDQGQQIRYEFSVYEESVSVVSEIGMGEW